MKLLAIDTSTELATVALAIDDVVFSEEQDSMRQHAQFLLPMVERVLTQAQLQLHQLDGIVFGQGPGSFTGLRITCSIAKGLAYAHDLPLFPVSSLAAIANEVYHTELDLTPDTRVLAMIDARMHQVYWGCFGGDGLPVIEQVSAAGDISQNAGPRPSLHNTGRLGLGPTKELILAGVGFESYIAQLPQTIQDQILKQRVVFPQARAMIRLVQTGQIQPVSAAAALPMYIRNQVTHGVVKNL